MKAEDKAFRQYLEENLNRLDVSVIGIHPNVGLGMRYGQRPKVGTIQQQAEEDDTVGCEELLCVTQ